MAGLKVVPIKALSDGSLDLPDLKEKAQKHKDQLAAFMVRGHFLSSNPYAHIAKVTYPSTFGVFEDGISEACKIVHANGGQVYLDGMLLLL